MAMQHDCAAQFIIYNSKLIYAAMDNNKKLTRSRSDKMLAGVCGGLAEYFGLDSSLVRIGYVLLSLFTAFAGVLVYIIMWLIVPEKR